MRSFYRLIFSALFSHACAHQSPPPFSSPASIEKSVFPVYVLDDASTADQLESPVRGFYFDLA